MHKKYRPGFKHIQAARVARGVQARHYEVPPPPPRQFVTPNEGWTYEGYWNAVLGANRSVRDVIREFDLDPLDRRGLDEWLGHAEAEAWRVGGGRGRVPAEWDQFHERALYELSWGTPDMNRPGRASRYARGRISDPMREQRRYAQPSRRRR